MISSKSESWNGVTLPSEDKIAVLCKIIQEKTEQDKITRRYAPVKKILSIVGAAGMVGCCFVMPGLANAAKIMLDESRKREYQEWKQYNPSLVRRSLKRLQQQKVVTIEEKAGEHIITLTAKGKCRILQYSLENLSIKKPPCWDGKWRLILYDVSNSKKKSRDLFRKAIKTLGFFQLQESVWIYPYPCEEQITFLREFYSVGDESLYVIAEKLENDTPYRTFFGIS